MAITYVPLHVHSHFSLLDGLSTPEQIVNRVTDIGSPAFAITDHGSVASAIQILNATKDTNIKPMLGCELYICEQHASIQETENRSLAHLPVIAKNDQGWKQLIQITSASNDSENFYHKPRLSLEQLVDFLDGSVMGFSGHLGSHLANALVDSDGNTQPNWQIDGPRVAKWMENAFGKGNFHIEIQLMMQSELQKRLGGMLRWVSEQTGIPIMATPDSHYSTKEQAVDQQVLLCTSMHTTMQEARKPTFGLSGFFSCENFHIPSPEELLKWGHTEEELHNTLMFASNLGGYGSILKDPVLPLFPCPDGLDEKQYLRRLCLEGWDKLIKHNVSDNQHPRYADEVKRELAVFEEAKLSGYFLICQDIISHLWQNGWLAGPGRGSAAGCLVSYLTGITSIDPMPYDLLFERFYNAGRNTESRVSLPDIDMDVPVEHRDDIIEYIKEQYGHDKVAQMITFQTMKARGALKDVLRAHAVVPFEEMNRITKNVPEEHKVAGELKEQEKEEGTASLIRYALEHRAGKFNEWVTLNDDGTCSGPLAQYFEQAMRLEGTKCAQSRHPAGVVISPDVLATVCPMVMDPKTKKPVCGLEMNCLESIGMLKLDILGLNFLDKSAGISQILEFGDIQ